MAGDRLVREHLECSICWVKTEGLCGPTLEEVWPDHAIQSTTAITKLPLGYVYKKAFTGRAKS